MAAHCFDGGAKEFEIRHPRDLHGVLKAEEEPFPGTQLHIELQESWRPSKATEPLVTP